MIIVKNGFESRNDRLVTGNAVKCIGELVVRGEESMKLPRPGERETGKMCLGIGQFVQWVTIVGFHSDNVNGGGRERRGWHVTQTSLEFMCFCHGPVWCRQEMEASLEVSSPRLEKADFSS